MKKNIIVLFLIVLCLSLASCTTKKDDISNKDFTFGKYPQTKVVDTETISKLSNINEVNDQGYIYYNDNEYLKYKEEYFLVEPIKWVCVNINGQKYYITEKIIDQQVYMSDQYFSPNLYSYVTKPGVPQNTHANNYMYSDLREWLNSYFVATAFTSGEVKKIKEVEVDNSLASTTDKNNEYICGNTSDLIFALSCYEATFLENTLALPTDYAVARGVVVHNDEKIDHEYNGYAASWLRTPSSFYSYCVSCINYNGIAYRYSDCYYLGIGVRPAFIYK